MKLWLLRPLREGVGSPWQVSDVKCFGFVVRAETASHARIMATEKSGYEGDAWLDAELSSCAELTADGKAEVVIRDLYTP